jgi:hypothetical protein
MGQRRAGNAGAKDCRKQTAKILQCFSIRYQLEQTTEAVAQDITGAAKTAAKGLPYVAPLAAVAAVVTLALMLNKGR